MIGDKETIEDRLYISSLNADAKKHNYVIRKHWGIENYYTWCWTWYLTKIVAGKEKTIPLRISL